MKNEDDINEENNKLDFEKEKVYQESNNNQDKKSLKKNKRKTKSE